ncbi:MAG TPA: hypothetical protein VE685_15615 [Thermoanaerobaculia bacterium]|nr:hypothetical protein [Thermoanaerobaculia bacterium]
MGEFIMSFTGLCCFVPDHDITDDSHRGNNRMMVLLVETKNDPPGHGGHGGHAHIKHLPLLVCPYESVDRAGNSRTEDDREGKWAIFFLDDQEIWLEEATDEPQLQVIYYGDSGEECPTLENARSFAWVAPMAEMSPGSQFIKYHCLYEVDEAHPLHTSVTTRMKLTKGEVGSKSFAAVCGGDIKWKFRNHRQVLSDSVYYKVEFNAENLVLNTKLIRRSENEQVMKAFPDGPFSVRQIRLRQNPQSVVEAAIRNMPRTYVPTTDPLSEPGDSHFAHFYKFSSQGNPTVVIPQKDTLCSPRLDLRSVVPERYKFLYEPDHGGSPTCPPTMGIRPPDEEASERKE